MERKSLKKSILYIELNTTTEIAIEYQYTIDILHGFKLLEKFIWVNYLKTLCFTLFISHHMLFFIWKMPITKYLFTQIIFTSTLTLIVAWYIFNYLWHPLKLCSLIEIMLV